MHSILVDLDGTLTDPAAGIIAAIQHALQEMGAAVPAADSLGWAIGPPLRQTFTKLLGGVGDAETAVAIYRTKYGAGGLFDATLYDGIADALAEMRRIPARLLLCTAKAEIYAERILDHFGLTEHFSGIYGADLAGTLDDKGDLIAHMIRVDGFDPARAVMVGDRANDVRAAARHGIPAVGVLWGYGDRNELSGATALCADPADLPQLVRRLLMTT